MPHAGSSPGLLEKPFEGLPSGMTALILRGCTAKGMSSLTSVCPDLCTHSTMGISGRVPEPGPPSRGGHQHHLTGRQLCGYPKTLGCPTYSQDGVSIDWFIWCFVQGVRGSVSAGCHLPMALGPHVPFPGGAAVLTRPRVPAHQPPTARTWVAPNPSEWSADHTASSGHLTSSMGRCWARAVSARPSRYANGEGQAG